MFSDTTKTAALKRSGGRCECKRKFHGHTGRCSARVTRATAHFHHVTAKLVGGGDGLANCEVLCVPCHRKTASYGRS